MRRPFIYFWSIVFLFTYACTSSAKKKAIRDSSITIATSYNPLFLDSVSLVQFISANTWVKEFENQMIVFFSGIIF